MDAADNTVYGSTLYAATAVARPESPALTFDQDVDVCVIGGGLAGLTTAREVARQGWSVILLEAKKIAWSASGRNTGFVLPGYAQAPEKIVQRVGAKQADALWQLSEQGLEYVRETIRERRMTDVMGASGWLAVSKTDQAVMLSQEADYLRDRFNADVEFWSTEQVRSQLKSADYFQALHFPGAFAINPLNYALGLAAAAEEAGVRIFENTPALSIDPDGVRKRVSTKNALVRARHLVLAGNVHLGRVMPAISRTILPVTTYVIATAPLGERLADAIAYRGAVSDTEWADNHYRVTEDNRLIWSGRMTTWQSSPRLYVGTLRRDIVRRFPQLGRVEVEFAWRGTLGNTIHRMPQIGEVSNGLWLASGFGGHGLNTTAMAGTMIARAIVQGDKTWMRFTPFELIWAGGMFGRAFAQGSYWFDRARNRLDMRRSRRNDPMRFFAQGEVPPVAETEEIGADTGANWKERLSRRLRQMVSRLPYVGRASTPRAEP